MTNDNNYLQLLLSIGLPHRIVELFKALYTDTVSCVRADGWESEWFPVNSGVCQGCVVAPDTFLVPMDWLLERTVTEARQLVKQSSPT